MSRTSYLASTWSSACVLLFFFATNTTAAALKGTVTARHDGKVKVDYVPDEKVAPAKGDTVIFSEIVPESEITLPNGTGTIKELGEGFVWVTVVTMNPRLQDLAIIEATGVVLVSKPPSYKDLFPPGQEGQNYAVKRKRGRLGAQVRPLTPEEAEAKGLSDAGLVILRIAEDSSAAQSGLLAGDIIRELNGTPVGGAPSFVVNMLLQPPGSPIEVAIWRDGSLLSKRVTLGEALVPDTVLQYHLSEMYWLGDGVPENHAESTRLLRLAADSGDAQLQNLLARRYSQGEGLEKDMAAAARYYRLAADQGYAPAQHNLALIYEAGDGVMQDTREALRYFQLAAEQGHAGAQNNLGVMYRRGQGVEKNFTLAAHYFQGAADQGLVYAQTNIAMLYEAGEGVPENLEEAVRWYKKAAAQDEKEALKALERLGR